MSLQKVKLTEHNMRRVFEGLQKFYKPMVRGQEDHYNRYFFDFDSNMLRVARSNPEANSRRAAEAVDLSLARMNGYLNHLDYDISALSNPANQALMHAVQMVYDPFVNPEIAKSVDVQDRQALLRQFEIPFKCLFRLRESIDFWVRKDGPNGYLQMVNQDFGDSVSSGHEMAFRIYL